MRTAILTIICIFFGIQTLFAQYNNTNLLVQSPDGKTVKVIWFINKWNPDITGFDIKRKDGLQDWAKLNSEPILPEISAKKNILLVESDKTEASRIKAKLYDLLSANILQQTDNKTYLQKLNSDDNAVREVANMVAHDYDLALMNGFAYVDHTVTKKMDYEYGLFIAGTDTLLDSMKWDYGQIPDLNAVLQVTSRSTTTSKGIEVLWDADLNKMKEGDIAGFNIYREGIRLNSKPIVAENNKAPASFRWYDKGANSRVPYQYSISAESIFGIEGIIKPYKYDPADHPQEYKKTEVTDIASLGYYFKEGIAVKWTFPDDYERYIKGFYVEKDNMPEGYKQVSILLDPKERYYKDTSASQVSGYTRFRVIAVYNDKTLSKGIPKLYSYFPARQSPIPENFKIKTSKKDNKYVVTLSWDPPMHGDNATDYYTVYESDTADNMMNPINNKPLHASSYSYVIDHGSAHTYSFCISSTSKNDIESPMSDTLITNIPTIDLQAPVINEIFPENKNVVIHWIYPAINDLKGFRLFQNNTLTATEKELNNNSREFIIPGLQEGTTYAFTLQAIANNGVISTLSAAVSFTTPIKDKK